MLAKELNQNDFNTVVRWIKRTDVDRLFQFSVMFGNALKRLKCRTRTRVLIPGVPEGSDHFDSGSLQEWLKSIKPEDKPAVQQVIILNAVIKNRLVG